tara:strand:- start:7101 stop:7277 length:177 start_codon:yes stop_codon:yes gene_type:complete
MPKAVKEQIIKEMKEKNKDIAIMIPKAVEDYVKFKYKCSKYLAKQISKELTNDGTGNN